MKEKRIGNTLVRIVRGDITDMEVDGFVYYARSDLVLGSGWGTAISVRGGPSIQEELNSLAPVEVGEAVITGAGEMKAKYIIHAVGPKFQEEDEEEKLRKTMGSALRRADEKGLEVVAFPPMGTGFYGVPVDLSARVMFEAIKEYLSDGRRPMKEIRIVLQDTRELGPFESALEKLGP